MGHYRLSWYFPFGDMFWKISIISEDHYTKPHARYQEGMKETKDQDGPSVSPVIPIAKGYGEFIKCTQCCRYLKAQQQRAVIESEHPLENDNKEWCSRYK